MLISSAFPSAYLKASDLQGTTPTVVISGCHLEDLGGETKPVLKFQGKDKGLLINRTNAAVLSSAFGAETDQWSGKSVTLYSEKVFCQGQMKDGLRVRLPQQPMEQMPSAPSANVPFDDDVAF